MTLKEKIEEEIKRLKEAKNMNELRKEGAVDYLQWVLSELKKMTCKNCKKQNTDKCFKAYIIGCNNITYCSEWEEK